MIYDNIYFHNVVDLVESPFGGLHMARFPQEIWDKTESSGGCGIIRSSNASEIRFVADPGQLRLYLSTIDKSDAQIVHLLGSQIYAQETLEAGKTHCVELNIPSFPENRSPEVFAAGGFSPNVYRIYSVGATLAYHGMDTIGNNVRPPKAEEMPSRRWLAYGSSITQCSASFYNYVNAAAQMLDVDPINLGMGGSCFVENEIADFIAQRDDWDFASFELGINLLSDKSDNKAFADKVDYLLSQVTTEHPDKPLFLITIFDNGVAYEQAPSAWQHDLNEKNEILRAMAQRYTKNVTLIEGTDIVRDFRGFQRDLLHPEPFAHTRMGLYLAEIIGARL
jgi:hypothetical protein